MTDVTLRCPTCGQPFFRRLSEAVPFCSDRCRSIDLGRWFGEVYAMPLDGTEERDPDDPDPDVIDP